jgi:DNA-binding response OmpR family regulator
MNLTKPKKIMILEDDEAIAELMRFYLQEEGLETAVSSRGAGFTDKVAEYQPDLITLDVLLPDTDGFRVFETIQQDERISHIPVIFVSVLEKEKEKGILMGARGYIVKPIKENEFKGTIKSVLEKEL